MGGLSLTAHQVPPVLHHGRTDGLRALLRRETQADNDERDQTAAAIVA